MEQHNLNCEKNKEPSVSSLHAQTQMFIRLLLKHTRTPSRLPTTRTRMKHKYMYCKAVYKRNKTCKWCTNVAMIRVDWHAHVHFGGGVTKQLMCPVKNNYINPLPANGCIFCNCLRNMDANWSRQEARGLTRIHASCSVIAFTSFSAVKGLIPFSMQQLCCKRYPVIVCPRGSTDRSSSRNCLSKFQWWIPGIQTFKLKYLQELHICMYTFCLPAHFEIQRRSRFASNRLHTEHPVLHFGWYGGVFSIIRAWKRKHGYA